MTALALGLAMLVGASLGVLGAGGAIVTVPVLVYVLGFDPHRAAATSLFVVGTVAFVGTIVRWPAVRPRTGLVFGAAGMLGAIPGAWLNHRAPSTLVVAGFGLTLLVAGARLLRGPATRPAAGTHPMAALGSGVSVGAATGFFGVGGGFLIVPALTFLLGVEFECAAATSLLVITLNSAAGLVAHRGHGVVDWGLGLEFAVLALLGALIAIPLARRLRTAQLQHAFAGLVLVLGAGMLVQGVVGSLR
jgi:uncharacterized membrane protein YfcA